MCVRDFVDPSETYALLSSFAARHGLILISPSCLLSMAKDCPEFSKEIKNQLKMRSDVSEKCKYFPSNFTPELVMRIVKKYMGSLP